MSAAQVAAPTVHLVPKDAAIKALCYDSATKTLRANLIFVDRHGSVVFAINELGLKGAPRDPSRKLAVVWGDSVVFGVRWSWPCLLDERAPGYQFLNGGIEADPYDNILARAAAFNRAQDVALNILMPGWHPIDPQAALREGAANGAGVLRRLARAFGPTTPADHAALRDSPPGAGNRHLQEDLLRFLAERPNAVLVTMPTALNTALVEQDLSPYFLGGDRDTVFSFAGDASYSLAAQRYLFAHVTERNAILRAAARQAGARLVDFAEAFDTARVADFRTDFHDVMHLRPRAYAKAAATLYRGIRDLL